MCAFSWVENACCCLRVVFAILKIINSLEAPTFSAGVLFLEPSHAVDCCSLSNSRYYPQVLLQFGHSRSLLVSECEDNKFRREMQVFRGLFFVECKFIFEGVRIYFFESAN